MTCLTLMCRYVMTTPTLESIMREKYATEIDILVRTRLDSPGSQAFSKRVMRSVDCRDVEAVRAEVQKIKARIRRAARLAASEGSAKQRRYEARPYVKARKAIGRALRHASVKGRSISLINAAKVRADAKGLPFSITVEWVMSKLAVGTCPATGRTFDLSQEARGRKSRNPNAPSLDRISPEDGYTPSNTQVVCVAYNLAKGELSGEELVQLCRDVIAVADDVVLS